MPDHSVAPELVDSVRTWAARLRDAGSADLEDRILEVAREVQAVIGGGDAPLRERVEAALDGDGAEQTALLLVDLDGFRVVSDGLGPDVAHQVLLGVARTLRATFGDAFVTCLGGDTFAVVARGTVTPEAITALAEEAIAALARPVFVGGVGVGVSASVGIAFAGPLVTRYPELMASAQVALHRAKELGRAQCVLFDPVAAEADRERYHLACGVAGALETGEMSVVYHPHVVLPDAQAVMSLNAVLRWNHPTLGALRADQFYPLVERTGMTVPLGRFLLESALRTAGEWRAEHGDDVPMVCLTLPRRMAIDADLVTIVRTELDRNGLAPRHVMLCTDGPALLDERGDLLESLGQLADLGVVFGLNVTGMAELELVPALQLPVPGVMLTGAIIDALEVDAPPVWAARTIRQLVERAEELGLRVGARGVISREHADLLFGLGVMVAGGPYLPTYDTATEAAVWIGRARSLEQA